MDSAKGSNWSLIVKYIILPFYGMLQAYCAMAHSAIYLKLAAKFHSLKRVPLLDAGIIFPRCLYASSVASRPRGVRMR